MLELLHPDVRVLAQRPGASVAEISAVQARYPALPDILAELMREKTDLELAYRGRYLRLYGPQACIEMNEAYSLSARIPGAVVVGDNGGSEAILFLPGRGIHRVGYGALEPDQLYYIANTLDDLLLHATAVPDAIGGVRA